MNVRELRKFLQRFEDDADLGNVFAELGNTTDTDVAEMRDELLGEATYATFELSLDEEEVLRSVVRSVLDMYGPVRESINGPKLLLGVINIIQDELTKNLVAHIQAGYEIEDWEQP